MRYVQIIGITVLLILISLSGCVNVNKGNKTKDEHTCPVNRSENEYFSVSYPKDWVCNDEGWGGKNSVINEMDLFPDGMYTRFSYEGVAEPWFHCVKSALHNEYQSADEAASMTFKQGTVVLEQGGLLVDGYPAHLTVMVSDEGTDTMVHRRYVVLIPNSYTVFYFTANYSKHREETDGAIMEEIIASIRFKPEVEKPVDNWLDMLMSHFDKMKAEQ